MAAIVRIISQQDWPVIRAFLDSLEEGAIVISPYMHRQMIDDGLKPKHGRRLLDYDFGGEPDIMLDVVHDLDHSAVEAIRKDLGLPQSPTEQNLPEYLPPS